jgi:hypothetical protein
MSLEKHRDVFTKPLGRLFYIIGKTFFYDDKDRKKTSYSLRFFVLSLTRKSPFHRFLQPFCNPFCNPYFSEYNVIIEKVAEKQKKNKLLLKVTKSGPTLYTNKKTAP